MRVYLIGFMGSGKTTFGKRLAKQLGYTFVDTDKLIETQEGMTIPDIFALSGEAHFRALEQTVLHQTAHQTNAVIACGGGTPCFFDNIAWMRANGVVVYLKVPEKELFKRLQQASVKRPLLAGLDDAQLTAFIRDKTAERAAYYEQAHQVIDPTAVSVAFVAEQLLKRDPS